MNATLSNSAPPTAATQSAAIPVVSADVLRRLPWTVATMVLGVGALTVVAGLIAGRADWWSGFAAALAIAVPAAAASVAVLNVGRGKTVDWLVTLTMAATTARLAVSGAGLLVAIKLLGTPPGPTAFAVCGYYAAVLAAEANLLTRAVSPAQLPARETGDTHA